MADAPRWKQKLDRDGRPVRDCWLTDSGYTVAIFRTPAPTHAITRPGSQSPFAYTPERDEVVALIAADQQAQQQEAGRGQ